MSAKVTKVTKDGKTGGTGKASAAQVARALETVPTIDDPVRLRALIANARRMGEPSVAEAAFHRLCDVGAQTDDGAGKGEVERDFWAAVHAVEEILREERGRAVRMTRTRQKATKMGERRTLEESCLAAAAGEGFDALLKRGMSGLTGEAVVIRHAAEFSDEAVAAARARLAAAGVADPV